jgi:phosphoserine phosphatase
MIKAVIFDIDGTLSKENSWANLAIGMGATPAEDLELVELQKNKLITDEEADRRMLALWKRKGLATKSNFLKVFNAIELREDALDLVQYLKGKGIVICLITGSMDLYAKVIADKVGADEHYSNAQLFWDEDGNITNLIYNSAQGALKLKQFKEFLQKYSLKPDDCAVVGDSENDYLLFQETKKGIAIRSFMEDKVLEVIAWKVIDNLSEIKNIIK